MAFIKCLVSVMFILVGALSMASGLGCFVGKDGRETVVGVVRIITGVVLSLVVYAMWML